MEATEIFNRVKDAISEVIDKSGIKISDERKNQAVKRACNCASRKNLVTIDEKTFDFYSKLSESADLLGVQRNNYIKSAFDCPYLFFRKPKDVANSIEDICQAFNIEREEYIKVAFKYPDLFTRTSKKIINNVKFICESLNLDEQKYFKVCLASSRLLGYNANTIVDRFNEKCRKLNLNENQIEWFKNAGYSKPNIFSDKADNILRYIDNYAKLVGVTKDEALKKYVSSPTRLAKSEQKYIGIFAVDRNLFKTKHNTISTYKILDASYKKMEDALLKTFSTTFKGSSGINIAPINQEDSIESADAKGKINAKNWDNIWGKAEIRVK